MMQKSASPKQVSGLGSKTGLCTPYGCVKRTLYRPTVVPTTAGHGYCNICVYCDIVMAKRLYEQLSLYEYSAHWDKLAAHVEESCRCIRI